MADYVLSAVGKFDGSNFTSGLKGAESALQSFKAKCDSVSAKSGTSLTGTLGKVASAATKVTAAIAGIATGAAFAGGISRALGLEQAQYKFKQLGLDVDKVMKSCDASVSGTKFSLDAAATAAVSLTAAGVEAGDQLTRSLQAAAGMATISGDSMEDVANIFSKVAATGKLQGDELNQFAERGISATQALSQYLGKTQADVRKMVTAGQIDFQTFSDAMYAAFGEAAYGANETFEGAMANAMSAVNRLTAKFAGPVLDGMKNVFKSAIPAINEVSKSLDPVVERFSQFSEMVSNRVASGLDVFTAKLQETGSLAQSFSEGIQTIFNGTPFEGFFARFGESVVVFETSLQSGMGVIESFKAAVTNMFGDTYGATISGIVDTISFLVDAALQGVQAFNSLDPSIKGVIASAITLSVALRPIVGIFASIAGGVAGFASKVASVGSVMAKIGDAVTKLGTSAKGTQTVLAQSSSSFANLSNSSKTAIKGITTLSSSSQQAKMAMQGVRTGVMSTSQAVASLNKTTTATGYGMKTTATGIKQVATSAQSASSGVKAAAVGMQQIGAAAQTASTGARLASTALNMLKGALVSIGIGVAVAGIANAVSSIVGEMRRLSGEAENVKKAMSVGDLSDSLRGAFSGAAEGVTEYTEAISDSTRTAAEAFQEQASLVDGFRDKIENIRFESSQLDGYMQTIEQLSGKIGQTAEDQVKLKNAVDGVNSIMGTSFSVVENENGVLETNTAEIERNIEAWKKRAEAMAASEMATDLYKENIKLQQDYNNAVDDYLAKQKKADDYAKGMQGTFDKGVYDTLQADADGAKKTVDDLTETIKQNSQSIDDLYATAAESEMALAATADEIRQAFGETTWFSEWSEQSGVSIDTVAEKLSSLGVTSSELATLTSGQLDILAQSWDGSLQDIVAACEEAGVEIPSFIKQMADQAAGAVEDGGQRIEDAVSQTAENITQITEEIKQSYADMGQGVDDAGRIFDEFGNQIGTVAGSAAEAAEQQKILAQESKDAAAATEQAAGNQLEGAQSVLDQLEQIQSQTKTTIDSIRTQFEGYNEEFQAIGTSLGNALSTGFEAADMASTYSHVDQITQSISGRDAEFTAIGTSWGNALSTGFASADMASTQASVSALTVSLSMRTAELTMIGTSWGQALSEGFGTSMATMGESLMVYNEQFTSIGTSWANSLSTGFAMADMASTQGAVQMIVASISGREGEFTAIGTSWGNALSTGFASADMASASAAVENMVAQVSAAASEFEAVGQEMAATLSEAMASSDIASTIQTAMDGAVQAVQAAASQFSSAGQQSGQQFASGIQGTAGAVTSAAQALVSAADTALQAAGATAFSSGSHVGEQFAAGIRSQVGAVSSAAAALAAAASAYIQHTKPDKGPLKKGEVIFGRHLAQNFADGMYDGVPEVARASERLAQTVQDYIGHTNPKKGPLSQGEWVYGFHTAQNYATGILDGIFYVTDAVGDVASSAEEEFERYIDEMIAGYRQRSREIKDITDDLAAYMWGVKMPDIMENYQWTLPDTGPVYEAARKIKDAGYEIQEFIDKEKDFRDALAKAEYGEGQIEKVMRALRGVTDEADIAAAKASAAGSAIGQRWGNEIAEMVSKLSGTQIGDLLSKATKGAAEGTDDYTRALKAAQAEQQQLLNSLPKDIKEEFGEWIELVKDLGVSFDELSEWAPLAELKMNLVDDITATTKWAGTLTSLTNRAGVAFSKNFVERIEKGGDEYREAMYLMEGATDAAVQNIVDSFDDLARAERLQEINTRSLWVNSLKTINNEGQNAMDWLLDFRETCLDVKEAIYSDSGLSKAFEIAGATVEGFAFDLQSLDYSMDDFVKGFNSFTASVSNGFKQMTSYEQTGFAEWQRNLKLNMAESQKYAENLATVMAAIPESVDSEAFRKAVMEGGFSQWGKVMSDMAKMSADEIAAAVELYNDAILEGQQSAIEQFRALAPGEELALQTIAGLTGSADQIAEAAGTLMWSATDRMESSYPDWFDTGEYLAHGIADGIQSQIGAIADSAAGAVRAAISAARAEGDIHSPSKKMTYIGEMLGEGPAVGITNRIASVVKAAANMTSAAISAVSGLGADVYNAMGFGSLPEPTYGSIGYRPAGEATYNIAPAEAARAETTSYTFGDTNIHATVRSEADARAVAREVARLQQRQARARGYA